MGVESELDRSVRPVLGPGEHAHGVVVVRRLARRDGGEQACAGARPEDAHVMLPERRGVEDLEHARVHDVREAAGVGVMNLE